MHCLVVLAFWLTGTVEDVKADEGRLLVRPDLLPDEVVDLELDEVQKLFKVRGTCSSTECQAGRCGCVVRWCGFLWVGVSAPDPFWGLGQGTG